MIKQWRLPSCLRIVLVMTILSASTITLADQQNNQAEMSSRKIYKGEVENTDYASHFISKESKYGGQVYTSELYQGPIRGPDYSAMNARSLHDGFYAGAEVGYDSYNMRNSLNVIQSGVSVFQQNSELNAVGVAYSLVGGYGLVFDNPLYIGAEFFYNYSQANTRENVNAGGIVGTYQVKSLVLGTYGLSLMPGIKLLDNVLLYLKGGYTRLEAKTYENSSVLNVNNAQSNGAHGVHYGLGLEAGIYKNWSIRGEYTHLRVENFKTRTRNRVTPSGNQFMFGVIVHFI